MLTRAQQAARAAWEAFAASAPSTVPKIERLIQSRYGVADLAELADDEADAFAAFLWRAVGYQRVIARALPTPTQGRA